MAKPPPRLFIDVPLGAGLGVPLSKDHVHYLRTVLRLGVGDVVDVFNGRDGAWRAEIVEAGKRGGLAAARAEVQAPQPPSRLTLLFAPVKKTPTEWLIQKATELGVGTLQPLRTERTVDPFRSPERYEAIAVEAAEQSERVTVPVLCPQVSLADALAQYARHQIIYADERRIDRPLLEALRSVPHEGPAAILIGPAGGFTDGERAMIADHPGALPVTLGPRILKAETAAVMAISVWQAARGDCA